MKTSDRLGVLFVAALLASPAIASPDEDHVLQSLRKAHPGTRFSGAFRTPIAGIYEVRMGDNIAYVAGSSPRYFIFGRILDTSTMRELTAARLQPAQGDRSGDVYARPMKVDIDALPLGDAIRTVRGSGSRVVYLFSDPGCPHCRRFEAELAKVDDLTVHTFVVPFLGESLPLGIVCSDDPSATWRRFMLDGEEPSATAHCAHALERNLQLARRWQIVGAPTLVFADGSRLAGYARNDEIESRLASAASL